MSNVGFSSLAVLKAHVLGSALQSSTEFDTVITAIGQGVAAQFEKFCNRKFYRTVGDTWIFSADRTMTVVPRFPIESVSAIAQKSSEVDGFVDLGTPASIIAQISKAAGMLLLYSPLGSYLSEVRVTYTGGFYWDITEDASGTQPAGSEALPADLKLAWLLQCRQVWQVVDKLGTDVATTGSASQFVTSTLATLELIPDVVARINPYRRFT